MRDRWPTALWWVGVLSPSVFAFVTDVVITRLLGAPEPSGRWLYWTLLFGFSSCFCAVLFMQRSLVKKIVFVLGTAAAMVVQVLAWGAYYISQTGVTGIQ